MLRTATQSLQRYCYNKLSIQRLSSSNIFHNSTRSHPDGAKMRFQPITGTEMPRFAGIATLMRLPHIDPVDVSKHDVHIGLVGVPWDGGTTNRSGARAGPRAVRDVSTAVRNVNRATGVNPFALCNCVDLGDAPVNPLCLTDSMESITGFYNTLIQNNVSPLTVGGDHLLSLPVLRAVAKDEPVGLIHIDAHADTWDSYFDGSRYSHGTVFRRAIEEGLVDPHKTVQVGLRGALYADALDSWGEEQGIRVIDIDDFHNLGLTRVLSEIHSTVGSSPTYVSFDIDSIDPAFAPGTGTPEIGGLTTIEALRLIRGLRGINMVGGDVVEVAPQYDPTTNTALAAATVMYELLCILSESLHKRRPGAN
mmetsp:Transcript_15965/g.24061  ORF Transcript_15965/g.24061 Transcript_15965/m.24061 type:complete len:364 (+) Transcript_15965:158-1249(+)